MNYQKIANDLEQAASELHLFDSAQSNNYRMCAQVIQQLLKERDALIAAADKAGGDEPDWMHPKIQGLIGADARNRIVIDLIWKLIKDPECDLTASDLEYWDTIHDALQEKLTRPQPQADEPVAWVSKTGFRARSDVASPYEYKRMEAWQQAYYVPLFTRPQPQGEKE